MSIFIALRKQKSACSKNVHLFLLEKLRKTVKHYSLNQPSASEVTVYLDWVVPVNFGHHVQVFDFVNLLVGLSFDGAPDIVIHVIQIRNASRLHFRGGRIVKILSQLLLG